MTTKFITPRIDVPIGRAVGNLVYFDANFLRTFLLSLSDRIGGGEAYSNTELATLIEQGQAESINQRGDTTAQEAMRAVDELRNEVSSLRSDCDGLRRELMERDALIDSLRPLSDLRPRVEQLEGQVLQ